MKQVIDDLKDIKSQAEMLMAKTDFLKERLEKKRMRKNAALQNKLSIA